MDRSVLSKISDEHFKLRKLMKCVTASNDIKDKRNAFNVIKQEIVEHMAGEEQSLYRYISELTLDRTYDHHEIKECLQRLNLIKMTDKSWDETYRKFCHAVELHCGDEEENLFTAANESFDTDMLILMEREYNIGKLEATRSF